MYLPHDINPSTPANNRITFDTRYHDEHSASRTALCQQNCFSTIRYTLDNAQTWQRSSSGTSTLSLPLATMRSRPYNVSIGGACSHDSTFFAPPVHLRVNASTTEWEICRFDNVPLAIVSTPKPRTSNANALFEFKYDHDTDATVRGPLCQRYKQNHCDGMNTVEYKLNHNNWVRTLVGNVAGELLVDGSFENGGAAWAVLRSPSIDQVVPRAGRHAGSSAMRIQATSRHGREQTNISVVSGNVYLLTAWWKIESLTFGSSGVMGVPAYVRVFNAENHHYIHGMNVAQTRLHQWVYRQTKFHAPNGVTRIGVFIGGVPGATGLNGGTIRLLFDDISLTPYTAAVPPTIRVPLTGLISRVHTMQVRSPCAPTNTTSSYTWEIDVTPPNTTIGGEAAYKRDKTTTFTLACSESGCGYRYVVDNQAEQVLGATGAWLAPDTVIVSPGNVGKSCEYNCCC